MSPRTLAWMEPIAFRAPRALDELRLAASRVNWFRVLILCSLPVGCAIVAIRRFLPDAELELSGLLIRGVGALLGIALLLVLLMMFPRRVTLAERSIVVQHGQHGRCYLHAGIGRASLATVGTHAVLRFLYAEREVVIGLASSVRAQDVRTYLRTHGLEGAEAETQPVAPVHATGA